MNIEKLKAMSLAERLAHFVAWLATQDRDTPYSYQSVSDCAFCKYARSWYSGRVSAGGVNITLGDEGVDMLDPDALKLSDPRPSQEFPIHWLQNCKTLGELHDKLLPFVGDVTPPELTDAEMDALESRELVAWEPAP